jgi:hypothetical protein
MIAQQGKSDGHMLLALNRVWSPSNKETDRTERNGEREREREKERFYTTEINIGKFIINLLSTMNIDGKTL